MRYRRVSYRYTVVAGHGVLSSGAAVWRRAAQVVMLGRAHWHPDADVCETPAAISVDVDLAGVAEDDVEIQLFEDALVIEGTRRLPACDEDGVYHAAGIRQGPFHLELPLPRPVDAERVEARYERGLLRIVLPKSGGRT
jgi:HSP20 family protein